MAQPVERLLPECPHHDFAFIATPSRDYARRASLSLVPRPGAVDYRQ